MEAKRYGEGATLAWDALQSKILNAVESYPDLEL